MSNIVLFEPKSQVEAKVNLRAFVHLCRYELNTFGNALDFDALKWDLTGFVKLKGRVARSTLTFSTLASSGTREPVAMVEPFCGFAKAYVRYSHAMNPRVNISSRLTALRVLEAALIEQTQGGDPVRIDTGVLNRAAQVCVEIFAQDTAVNIANEIKKVAEFMSKKELLHTSTSWKHSLKRGEQGTRVGKDADERRAQLMPSQRALDGLAAIFHQVQEPNDVLISSVTAILCSAPDRVSELLELPDDCEVKQKFGHDNSVVYGLRWWPAKGADPMVKWIVPSMAQVVEEAIRRIRAITTSGRNLAKFYEDNPTKLYLPVELEYLRSQEYLSMPELGRILYGEGFHSTSPLAWVRSKKLETIRDMNAKSRPNFVRFVDVEHAILEMLPKGFPFVNSKSGFKYSESLFVVLENTLISSRATLQCMIEPVSYSHVTIRLGNGKGTKSIFEKFGFYEDDGSSMQINTHQFRHYLNTIAQRGGLSQLDIAKWSGRRDVAQNIAYDHIPGSELVDQMRAMVGNSSQMLGPITEVAQIALIPRDEFARLKIPTAHTTELGYCIHDFTMSPCQLHRDCMSCEELLCVKGDVVRTERIQAMRSETTMLLKMAEDADSLKNAGANRWVAHQQAVLQRLNQLCEIFDDPAIPSGALIQQVQLNDNSRFQLAVQAREELLGADDFSFAIDISKRM